MSSFFSRDPSLSRIRNKSDQTSSPSSSACQQATEASKVNISHIARNAAGKEGIMPLNDLDHANNVIEKEAIESGREKARRIIEAFDVIMGFKDGNAL